MDFNCSKAPVNVSKGQISFTSDQNSRSSLLDKSHTFPPLTKDKTNNSDCSSLSGSRCSTPIKQSVIDITRFSDEASYSSPVSPLYKNNSFNTPKNKKSSLCLADFMTKPRKSSSKKEMQKSLPNTPSNDTSAKNKLRRINPTSLNQKKTCANFGQTENSFNFTKDFVELNVDNTDKQRNLLVEERTKIETRVSSGSSLQVTAPRLMSYSSNRKEIVPNFASVTHRDKLDILVGVYVFFWITVWY